MMAGANIFGQLPGRLGYEDLGNGRSGIDVYLCYGLL